MHEERGTHQHPVAEEPIIDVEQIYKRLSDIYTEEEFETEIKRTQDEFASLLDRETAALFLLAERGRFRPQTTPISALSDGDFVSVEGRVTAVEPVRTFRRKDGSTGRVVSVMISDGTGEARVSFWTQEAIESVERGEISKGISLRIVNARVKVNDYGTTVNVGNYSVVKVSRDRED